MKDRPATLLSLLQLANIDVEDELNPKAGVELVVIDQVVEVRVRETHIAQISQPRRGSLLRGTATEGARQCGGDVPSLRVVCARGSTYAMHDRVIELAINPRDWGCYAWWCIVVVVFPIACIDGIAEGSVHAAYEFGHPDGHLVDLDVPHGLEPALAVRVDVEHGSGIIFHGCVVIGHSRVLEHGAYTMQVDENRAGLCIRIT